MDEDEMLYREMNEEDDFYMGDKRISGSEGQVPDPPSTPNP